MAPPPGSPATRRLRQGRRPGGAGRRPAGVPDSARVGALAGGAARVARAGRKGAVVRRADHRSGLVVADRGAILRVEAIGKRREAGQSDRPAAPERPFHCRRCSPRARPRSGVGAGATLNDSVRHQVPDRLRRSYYWPNEQRSAAGATRTRSPGRRSAPPTLVDHGPDPIGSLRLQFRVGAFIEVYAGPGQKGVGDLRAGCSRLRGYGETANGEWDLTRDVRWRLSLTVKDCSSSPGCPRASGAATRTVGWRRACRAT